MLNRMKKRKETQYQYRLVQTPKRGNIYDVANGVAQVYGSITRFITRRCQDVRGSNASSSGLPPTEDLPPKPVTIPHPPPPQTIIRRLVFIRP
eukprot:3283737-Heterocapsa_arctica.AAC.1